MARVFGLVFALILVACGSVNPSSTPVVPTPLTIAVAATPAPEPSGSRGCGDPCRLYLENRRGPAFTVKIANIVLQTVACNAGAEITPGQGNVPQLP